MVLAEELAERRRREHAPGPVADMEDAGDPGIAVLTQGNHERRRAKLVPDRPVRVVPEPLIGTPYRRCHGVYLTSESGSVSWPRADNPMGAD